MSKFEYDEQKQLREEQKTVLKKQEEKVNVEQKETKVQKQDKASKILGVKDIKEEKSIEKVNKVLGTNFTKDLDRIQEPKKPNIFARAFSAIKERVNKVVEVIKQAVQGVAGGVTKNTPFESSRDEGHGLKGTKGLSFKKESPTKERSTNKILEETKKQGVEVKTQPELKEPVKQTQEPQKVEEKKLTTEQVQKNDLDIKNWLKEHNQKVAELKKQNMETPAQTSSKPKIEKVKVKIDFEQATPVDIKTAVKPVKDNVKQAESLEVLKENLNRPKTQAKTVTKGEVSQIRSQEVNAKIMQKFNFGGKGGGMGR